ncbi:HD-GYP domain-containing protein [Natroniella sulfidigena]|uniref:HD-GYP domain-containing protein n=1 Tax=Natroniella sulfidigena TaxID=723921 RepID=UPI00200A100F|nr:HD-GYP domain-containing protein [Natroniella sulfidigena]MCK8817433.1 HD-GYP domain-containing protein [Natroniella sulfidigena]
MYKQLVKVAELSPGAVLAEKVFNFEQEVLLKKGTELTKNHLGLLARYGIDVVYIYHRIQETEAKGWIRKKVNSAIDLPLQKVVVDSKIDQRVRKLVDEVVSFAESRRGLLSYLHRLKSLENDIVLHSVNVTVFSLIIGCKLGYGEERLKNLALGSFLHDIGKSLVGPQILNQSSKLTSVEFTKVQKHTVYGYRILEEQLNINELAARVAYYHHERGDGSGYPDGIRAKFVDEFSRIVAIADVFDAMTNHRTYRAKIKLREVIEYLYVAISQNKLDQELTKIFLDCLLPYPVGTKVKLSIGCEAIVTKVDRNAKMRPVVELTNLYGLNKKVELDLSKQLHICIEEVIN